MKTPEVLRALERRHGDQHAWVTIREFARIDLLAMACHVVPDRRRERQRANAIYPWIAYEVKVSRSDFRRELADPYKRRRAVAATHEFYFAAPAGLIARSEVPEDCGLVEVLEGGGTRMVVPAPITEARTITKVDTAHLLRHGMNPSWLRSWEFRKASLKWQQQQAEQAQAEARETRDDCKRLLAESLAHTIAPGQRWKARGGRWYLREQGYEVEVVKVGDRTVKFREESRFGSFEPLMPIGDFLLDFEPSPTAAG